MERKAKLPTQVKQKVDKQMAKFEKCIKNTEAEYQC